MEMEADCVPGPQSWDVLFRKLTRGFGWKELVLMEFIISTCLLAMFAHT